VWAPGPVWTGARLKIIIGNNIKVGSNNNGIKIVNLLHTKNLVVHSTKFPHRDIHKYTWTSPDGKTHKRMDHIVIDRRWHSSMLDVRSFRGADCPTDQYVVVAKVRGRLAVSKQVAQNFDGERLNIRKLNELAVRRHYQIEITNRFAALQNLNVREDIYKAWENIEGNIEILTKEIICLYELKMMEDVLVKLSVGLLWLKLHSTRRGLFLLAHWTWN